MTIQNGQREEKKERREEERKSDHKGHKRVYKRELYQPKNTTSVFLKNG